jgi:hypothetical protein
MGTFGGAQPIVTDGLVFAVDAANYESYTSGSTTWSDLAGSNNGTLINGPTFDSGNGGSIVFDGTNAYIQNGYLDNGGGSGTAQSYNIWFKADTLNVSGTSQGLLFWDVYNGIRILHNSGEIGIQTDGDNSDGDFSPTPTATTNTWHNVAFNFNQGVSYECWFDGVSFGSAATSDTSGAPSTNLLIGAKNHNGITQDFFNGNIAIVQAYNRALSSTEVLQNYNAQKGRFGIT